LIGAPREVCSGMTPAQYGRARSSPSSGSGGPLRILADASAIGMASTVVADSSLALGGRQAAERPGATRSISAASAASLARVSSTRTARPNTTTER